MNKKYTLIESNYCTIQDDHKLYQIQAIRSFSGAVS